MYGKWQLENGKWLGREAGAIRDDPQNRFIHLMFDLSDGKQLALSDLRKFAKVLLWPTDKLDKLEDINNLGPDPTAEDFDLKNSKNGWLAKRKG